MMISDGFGPSGETMARVFANKAQLQPLDYQLRGASITYSTSNLVTDSAAGATCFSCALKTYNGAIGVTDSQPPEACATVLEAAAAAGMATGVVVTSRVTHATPAAFTAHVPDREMEPTIAEQQITQKIDLLFGGGRCEFQPQSVAGSCRADEKDVMSEARDAGFSVITDVAGLRSATTASLPLIGLFAQSHMAFELDRVPADQPSLDEMVAKALELLSALPKAATHGMFLMIEGSRIDHAGHNNDAAAHVYETLQFQQAFSQAVEYARGHGNTVVVSTSDHETGGLTLARTKPVLGRDTYPYVWYPKVLARANHSAEYLAHELQANASMSLVDTVVVNYGIEPTPAELATLEAARINGTTPLTYALSEFISYHANVGWTTHGHTGEDVNLYLYGPGTEAMYGVHQNSDIGAFLASKLKLDLAALTPEIRRKFPPIPMPPTARSEHAVHD
ncbi:alkaline phosphatase [Thecamonas trahens ATCC 50062]|uniref:Alkaline phosphatase n=1 Tax=Thecamonas trahens ATCC 50062 TaxID=461836 RepID=A0A0L0DJL0_THETB|nr:alkaline phosphatase [Thecamonas trahens ATCC 50062]KNC52584.1 alkaline phosphatase [Thecamonas trahens ATCC 50062]|eukprot:XP_013755144.1 alkaline phosphatase [Thecamonas trahens ATCC 50062]